MTELSYFMRTPVFGMQKAETKTSLHSLIQLCLCSKLKQYNFNIARPLGLQNNHYVSLSVHRSVL